MHLNQKRPDHSLRDTPRQVVTVDAGGTRKVRGGIMKPDDTWSVLPRDRHEGYIGWDGYERNRRVIAANTVGNRGAPRGGRALLAGLVSCGHCQRRMQPVDNGKSYRYRCSGASHRGGGTCIGFGGVRVDAAVGSAVLAAAQPLGVAAALEAFERRGDDVSARIGLAAPALEEARYRAGRAQARFDAVDPANHNILHNLAARWEACLAEVAGREERLRDPGALRETRGAGSADRDAWLAPGADLERAFRSHRGIPAYREGERRERGELSLAEASARLGVNPAVVRRLIGTDIPPARQIRTGVPWAIAVEDLETPRVVAALSGCRTVAGADPDQGEFAF